MTHRLLQVITSTQRRGSEVFGFDLGGALALRGWTVRTVALEPGGDDAPLPVRSLGGRRLGVRTLAALHREARWADVVIAHGSTTLPACAVAVAGTSTSFVYRNIGDPRHWASTRSRRLRSGILLRRAARVVALWPGAADALRQLYGLEAARLTVIPNAVDAERFRPADAPRRAECRRRLGLAPDLAVVLYLGALSEEKNVAAAISAVERLTDARLVVAGHGPERARLEALARRGGGRVTLLGATADSASLLAAADVLVLPSRTEGLPAVLIEAGLSGVPAVATDVGGTSEIVRHGETGFLVPSGDVAALAGALRAALSAPAGIGAAARAHCLAHFELGRVAAAWADVLGALRQGPQPA